MLGSHGAEVNRDKLVRILKRGGVVACATETQIGLLADAENPDAVQRVLDIKGREASQTLGCIAPSLAIAEQYLELGEQARELAKEYWPGPLTLVARAIRPLADAVLKDGRVGVRVPGPSAAADLVWSFGGLLTATSANQTGEPALVEYREVIQQFRGRVAAIVERDAPGGEPSTVVDVRGDRLFVLREGAVQLPDPGLR